MTDLIAGRYELRARISKGGMGAVWSARDRRLRRDVAVKLLHAWIAEDLELRRRFAREARVLAPLEHENIVRLYDYGEDGETPFLVMELVEGANLGDFARNRVFSWAQAAEIALPIASALAYAHARGIVHRDLTPGNVAKREVRAVKLDPNSNIVFSRAICPSLVDRLEAKNVRERWYVTGVFGLPFPEGRVEDWEKEWNARPTIPKEILVQINSGKEVVKERTA